LDGTPSENHIDIKTRRSAAWKMRLYAVSLCFCVCAVFSGFLHAAETPIPSTPTQWVTDTANFMSPGAAQALNSRLQDYERATGHQLLVYIAPTTGDTVIEDWAVKAFEKWKVGRKGIDDGLVLFVMASDRKLRFEVGYGLEPVVPDAIAGRVINDVIVPRIQAGDRDGAINAGMDAVMTVIGGGGVPAGPTEAQRNRGREGRPMTLGQLIVFGVIGLIILFVFITNPSLALYLLASILSGGGGRRGGGWGGGGGGDWGGGGGFSGGGGRSGGGGASGSW
jgi:uncharacterized protein